jgi:tetratricopeptide (TPR) repeat protein
MFSSAKAKLFLWIKKKWQPLSLTHKRVLVAVAVLIGEILLARYGSLVLLKLIGSALKYKEEAAFFLMAASTPAVVWVFGILKKQEQAAKKKSRLSSKARAGERKALSYGVKSQHPAFDQIVGKSSQNANTHFNQGRDKLKREDLDDAIKDFDKALELDPNHADAYRLRAFAKLRKGMK